jgi:chemotaxis protein MotB
MKRLSYHENSSGDEVDAEGSWAISYGDMLTLLLAFFILFFSIDPQKTKDGSLARALMMTLSPLTELSAKPLVAEEITQSTQTHLSHEIVEEFGAEISQDGNRIIVQFPGISFFGTAKTDLSSIGQEKLDEFAKLYTPFAGTHFLNIMGYADERPLKSRSSAARDNLELSALRAVAALRQLQLSGIPLDRMRLGGQGVKRTQGINTEGLADKDRLASARRIVLVIERELQP